MQTLIKEYGHSVISGVVLSCLVLLIILGLALLSSTGLMTGTIDRGIVRAEAGSGENALKQRLAVRTDNISMKGNTYVGLYQKVYYENDEENLIGLENGKASRLHINSVSLIKGKEHFSDGYEVTDQVVHEDLSGNNSYMEFTLPGIYRVVVSVTDSNSLMSTYQLFIHVGQRRMEE